MEKDDLTTVKHIGAARMKALNDSGISTIKALFDLPLSDLAQIGNIGEYYAGLIKDAVADVYLPSPETVVEETGPKAEKEPKPISQGLRKKINLLNKRLKQANEKLKPLGKKKYLEDYVDVKKRSGKLKQQLKKLSDLETRLPKKVRIRIKQQADSLAATLKNVSKKPKKKTYTTVSEELRSFNKMLRNLDA